MTARMGYTFAIEIKTIAMATINFTDTLYATVTQRGVTLANLTLMGMTSFPDIVRELRSALGNVAGITTLLLRNTSQGWSDRRALMF